MKRRRLLEAFITHPSLVGSRRGQDDRGASRPRATCAPIAPVRKRRGDAANGTAARAVRRGEGAAGKIVVRVNGNDRGISSAAVATGAPTGWQDSLKVGHYKEARQVRPKAERYVFLGRFRARELSKFGELRPSLPVTTPCGEPDRPSDEGGKRGDQQHAQSSHRTRSAVVFPSRTS